MEEFEVQREQLFSRANEAIGGCNPILAKVLSYFPEQAESFIKAQTYAAKIEGKPDIWINIRHPDGRLQNLNEIGFTGENVAKKIQIIQALRGETWRGEKPFSASPEEIDDILSVVDLKPENMSVWQKMDKKILEVMNAGPEDIGLLKAYKLSLDESETLSHQAEVLRNQAHSLDIAAEMRIEDTRKLIDQKYPRKPKSEQK